MRRFKTRLQKKYYSRAAEGLRNGTITPFYAKKALEAMKYWFDYQYLVVFRPWWYKQDWKEHPLKSSYQGFIDKATEEIEEESGIKFDELSAYMKTLQKRKRNRKPRKEKVQPPIRKLKNPREFKIYYRQKDGSTTWLTVTGELVFSYREYDFFIRHEEDMWIVSDVATGRMIAFDERYKKAVLNAKDMIEKHFETYVSKVKKFRQEETA